jgi:hypothetical protein
MRRHRMLLAGAMAVVAVGATVVFAFQANAATSTYEAEASGNSIAGGARVANCSGCSGGRKVGFVGNNSGTLQFNGVSASAAGSAQVTIAYTNGGATRTAQLTVNGGSTKTLSFANTGSFNTTGTVTTSVTLRAGNNSLKFANTTTGSWAPDFDKITVVTGGGGGGGAPTAAELLAKVTSCSQISNGKYRSDQETSANIPVCGKNGAVFWKADMDIDCDGQRTEQCNEDTDCCFLPETFCEANNRPLNAAALPYVVLPSPSGIFDYRSRGLDCGTAVAVIFNNRIQYAVVGDTGPAQIIGEASYATADRLGIDPDPSNGGTDSGVTYIFFEGQKVSPIDSQSRAVELGQQLARQFINNN